MALLEPSLAAILRCPSCAGTDLSEAPTADAPSWGVLSCDSCERRYLVAGGVPVLLRAIEGAADSRAELIDECRAALAEALGRFTELLGGIEQALERCESGPLERGFDVPGSSWLNLERFSTGKFPKVPLLVTPAHTLLDLGCGYGASAVPFLVAGRAARVIGVDENLLFLLLFRRYCRERSLPVPEAVCFDLGRFPYPFRGGIADTAVAISFFNHFASSRPAALVEQFFREIDRLVEPAGTFAVDMVPNRLDPFPREINLTDVVTNPSHRRRMLEVVKRLPVKWAPGAVVIPCAWAAYRAYAALARRPAPGLREFRTLVPKAVPELALGGLPLGHRRYRRLLGGFERVEVIEEQPFYRSGDVMPAARFSRTPYFILRATRGKAPA
jgi:SAM-dependent methyltransferase/uncharacterized protein YbaR (Trm112 family)